MNPEGLKNTELIVRQNFLQEEEEDQQPTFAWESKPDTRLRTYDAIRAEKKVLNGLLNLENALVNITRKGRSSNK